MADTFKVVALYDYAARDEGEINLTEGDILLVDGKDEEGWYHGTNEAGGDPGYFPETYVQVCPTVAVLYPYKAQDKDELSIKEGDQVLVLNWDDDSEWAEGELNGKRGVFPRTYVEWDEADGGAAGAGDGEDDFFEDDDFDDIAGAFFGDDIGGGSDRGSTGSRRGRSNKRASNAPKPPTPSGGAGAGTAKPAGGLGAFMMASLAPPKVGDEPAKVGGGGDAMLAPPAGAGQRRSRAASVAMGAPMKQRPASSRVDLYEYQGPEPAAPSDKSVPRSNTSRGGGSGGSARRRGAPGKGKHLIQAGFRWAPAASEPHRVRVGTPVLRDPGRLRRKYSHFPIMTEPAMSAEHVHRRFTDFTWVRQQLKEKFPGIVLPGLPEKREAAKFTPEFLERRRRNLERFCQRIAAHPVLSTSAPWIAFVSAGEREFAQAMKASSKDKQKGTYFFLTVQTEEHVPRDIDTQLAGFREYARGFSQRVRTVKNAGRDLAVRRVAEAQFMKNHSRSYPLLEHKHGCWRKKCQQCPSLVSALNRVSAYWRQVAQFQEELANKEVSVFVDMLNDYIKSCQYFLDAIALRDTLKTVLSRGTDRKKAGTMMSDSEVKMKQHEIKLISQVLLTEMARFHSARLVDMHRALQDLARTERDTARKVSERWDEALTALKADAESGKK